MDGEPESQPAQGSARARFAARRRQVGSGVTAARGHLEKARGRSRGIDAAFRTVERDVEAGGGVLAAAVAFRVFLFMVPYVLTLAAGFGVATGFTSTSPGQAARSAGVAGLIGKTLGDLGQLSLGERVGVFAIALFSAFLAARALVQTLVVVHALIWRVSPRQKVNRNKGAALLGGIVTGAAVLTGLLGFARGQSFWVGIGATLLFVLVPAGAWLWISWLLPRDRSAPWWALVPGSVVVGAGIEILHLVTVYWIAHKLSSMSQTYGDLGAALALLLWAYVVGRLLIASAVTNAALWYRDQRRHPEPTAAVAARERVQATMRAVRTRPRRPAEQPRADVARRPGPGSSSAAR
jgi:uncharacterized BrkB/YihY/UPF0761 family membrane protein